MKPPLREKMMVANWKMHKTATEVRAFFARFNQIETVIAGQCRIVVAPAYPCLPAAVEAVRGRNIAIAGQNLHWESSGAYTGAVSAAMLADVGCTHVIVGHSERRRYFGETNESVRRKVKAAIAAGLIPIVCFGETAKQRDDREAELILGQQFESAFWGLDAYDLRRCIMAYEPIWAVGTGVIASPKIAQGVHHFLRHRAKETFGADIAASMTILYGGSVKPGNEQGLMEQPDVDGGLIGGASLDPDSFAALVAGAHARSRRSPQSEAQGVGAHHSVS